MPYFSVIIPSYNRDALIGQTLESVFAQTFTDYEILVVDDGSTDDTSQVLAAYADRIRVLHQKNQGAGAARNLGMQHARGMYLVFLDSDDIWFTWTLETFHHVLQETDQPALMLGTIRSFHGVEELHQVQRQPLRYERFDNLFSARGAITSHGAIGIIVRAEAAKKVGGFVSQRMNAEDVEFLLRVGDADGYVHISQPVTLGYRFHAQNISKSLDAHIRGMTYIVEQEHAGRYPGRPQLNLGRWHVVTFFVRCVVYASVVSGRWHSAWWLYRKTFLWNLRLGRWRYLIGFWVLLVIQICKAAFRRAPNGSPT